MEEMVFKLKTRGSLSSRRRSRSRSRRSKARQTCEGGVIVTNVRVVQAFPIRETDSDDSNTESRTSFSDIPTPFFSTIQQNPSTFSNNRSNSSFHSATESDGCTTPQTASPNKAEEEEEEEGRPEEDGEESVDGNGAANDRDRTEDSIRQQIQEISPYGPEEFVLDLLIAMCRGSWSDIL